MTPAGANSPDTQLGSDAPAQEAGGAGAPRLRDGLGEELPSATVSILVKLVGDPIGYIVIDFEARFGPRSQWSPAILEQATEAIRIRDMELDAQHARVLSALSSAGLEAQTYRDYRLLANGFNLRDVPAAVLPLLEAQADVALVERDRVVWAEMAQSVPLINADDVWTMQNATGANITGLGTLIANIDTGVDYTHPDLGGTLNRTNDFLNLTGGTHPKFAAGWDFVNNDNDPWDGHLHGTHVAGTIGANGTIKGVAPNSMQLALKVLADNGYGSDSDIIAAMEYAADPDDNPLTDDGADASSMSLGGWDPNPDGIEPLAADTSSRMGTLCVIAAGNSGAISSVGSPGVSRDSITVGSTTKADVMSGFSSRGPTLTLDIKPDLVAPGSSIVSTRWGGAGGNLTLSGTSMATPHVSGAVALIRQAHPEWTVDQLKSALVDTAKDLGYGVFEQGGGRLDALAAVSTSVFSTPHKLAMGRLERLNSSTNATLSIENVGSLSLTLNLSAKDVFGMRHDLSRVNNNTDLDFVTVAPTSITLAPGARTNITIVFAPSSSAVPGHYWGTVLANGSNQTLRVPFAYSVRAPILLVDDDSSDRWSGVAPFDNYAGFPSACNNLSWSLDRLSHKHDIFTAVHYTDDGPALADLVNYPLVIWCTGYDYDYSDGFHSHESISTRDRQVLASYLDRGGQLWLIGENIAWDVFGHANTTVSSSNFFNAYLGVARVDNELNTPNPINGTPGTFMANASYTTAATWSEFANNGDYATHLTPTSRAFTIFNSSTTDVYGKSYPNASLAVAVDNATYRSVYWGFEFSWLGNSAAFDDAMTRTLAFFSARVGLVNNTSYEGQLLDFRGLHSTLPSPSLYSYSWSFSDSGNATARNTTHTFADDGNYTATLRVTSGPWFNQTAVMNITVLNLAPVVVAANASAQNVLEGTEVNFTGSCTDPGPLDVVSYAWSFGDSTANVSGDSSSHTFADEGDFVVTLTCSDGDGGAVASTLNVTIVNADPTITTIWASGPPRSEGVRVFFGAVCADLGSADNLTYTWDFGDGDTATGINTTHVYLDDGRYNVTLTCSDGDGGTVSGIQPLNVGNVPPSASISALNETDEGYGAVFIGSASDVGVLDVLVFSWDFGDGTTAGDLRSVSHAYADNGVYFVAMRVIDGDGGSITRTHRLAVRNVAPSVTINATGPFEEGLGISFDPVVLDPGTNDTFTYVWSFGDGFGSAQPFDTHAFLDEGTYNVTLTVTDDDGGATVSTLMLSIANAPPSIDAELSGSLAEGSPITLTITTDDAGEGDVISVYLSFSGPSRPRDVLIPADFVLRGTRVFSWIPTDDGFNEVSAYATDVDGGGRGTLLLFYVSNVAPRLDLANATLQENQSFAFDSMVSDPGTNDTVVVSWQFSDGLFAGNGATLSRAFAQEGTYFANVTATDDDGGTVNATIRIEVSNIAPELSVNWPANLAEGVPAPFEAMTRDEGPFDVVTVRWAWGDGTESTGATSSHIYADVGTYYVTVTASDGSPLSPNTTTVLLMIEVTNTVPTVDAIRVLGLFKEGSPLDFEATITDPTNDELNWTYNFGDGSSSHEAAPRHTFLDQGTFTVRLTVRDPEGATATLTRQVEIVNEAPHLACAECPGTALQGRAFNFSANATDAGALDVLTFRLTLPDNSVVTSHSGAYNVTMLDAGSFDLNLTVADKDGGVATLTFHIVVLPDPDGDGMDNAHDADDDGDGTPDIEDPAPLDPMVVAPPVTTPGGLAPWLLVLIGAAGVLGVFFVLRRRRRNDDA